MRKTIVRIDAEYGRGKNSLTRYFAPFYNVALWKTSGAPICNGLAAANAAVDIGKSNATSPLTFFGNDASFHNLAQTVFSLPAGNRVNSVVLPGVWRRSMGKILSPKGKFIGPQWH